MIDACKSPKGMKKLKRMSPVKIKKAKLKPTSKP